MLLKYEQLLRKRGQMQNSTIKNEPLYDYRYAKNDRLGFTSEQDLKILHSLYPNARKIKVTYSVPGEAHFVIING